MANINILWADDEIDILKPQIIFLEHKGYTVIPVTNGQDAITKCKEKGIDIVFLDESMPGLSGLETLAEIKAMDPTLPVVMITKNEEEDLMEDAIGSQISDYLIKPVKPNQILLTLKRLMDNKRLVSEKTTSNYQKEFQKMYMTIQDRLDFRQWTELYQKLVYWELELGRSEGGMDEVFSMQKQEANREFCKFVSDNYLDWLDPSDEDSAPIMSHNLLERRVLPLLTSDHPTFLIVIDNLRLDQWKIIQPLINEQFRLVEEDTYYSILPTATQYARNALFSGLLPTEIAADYPDKWKMDDDEGGKNMHEGFFMEELLRRSFNDPVKSSYTKVTNHYNGKQLEDNILNHMNDHLVAIVYNFVDMLSHARTEMEVLKELASDESAYRSLTLSWYEHSPLHNALKKLADKKVNLIFTTDNGTIRVKSPSKCIAERNTTSNMRYKSGKNLNYDPKAVFDILKPSDAFLPSPNVSTRYIFAKEDTYLVYPNNYNHFVNFFNDTFQHGGVSLEEMIIPFAVYTSR